jgi:hypothetical protein
MTNFLEDDNVSSSSSSPTHAQEPRDFTVYGRFPSKHRRIKTCACGYRSITNCIPPELRRIRTHAYGNKSITNCSPTPRRISNWNVVDDDRITSTNEKGFFYFILIMFICFLKILF